MEKITFINRENLLWARGKSGFDFPHIYKKAGWSPTTGKIQKWENGEDFPTVNELRKLGDVYKRQWVLFILKKDVKNLGFKPLEFRKIFGEERTTYNPSLVEFLYKLKNRQDFLIEFADVLGLEDNHLVGLCKGTDDINTVAEKIITHTEIDMDAFRNRRTRRDGFNYLTECLERKNIFVSSTSSHADKVIPVEQMRGVLMNSDIAPIIGINTRNESYGARIFTVFHELTHLFMGDSFDGNAEVTRINFRDGTYDKNNREHFCDAVAARILVPDDNLKKINTPIRKELIERMSVLLKVNHQPLLYRMRDLGLLNEKRVNELLKELREDKIEVIKSREKESERGPDGGFLKMLQNGRAFIHAVNTLHSGGEITFTQALNVLDVKAETYKKFAGNI